jgi:DNA (cytosine-5)-methyltransferase 1
LAALGFDAEWGVLGGGAVGNICEGERIWILAFAPNSPMLEGLDVSPYLKPYSEESRRRQHSRAISAMLSQDDYSGIKRNPDAVAAAMDRLKAIGNGQVPAVAATAFRLLAERAGVGI